MKTNGDDGVRVAEVQADLDLHGVTVETTADKQVVRFLNKKRRKQAILYSVLFVDLLG